MEEILKRLGVPVESWIISVFAACLIAIYRIFEPEEPISKRKMIRIVIMCISCALLVPGLALYWMTVKNPFFSGVLTGLSVYCFEPLLDLAKNKFINKAKSDLNGSPKTDK